MSSPKPAPAPAPVKAAPAPAAQPRQLTSYEREQQEEERFSKSLTGQRNAARRASNRLGVISSGAATDKVSLLGGRASSALL